MSYITLMVFYVFSAVGLVDTVYLSYHAIKKTPVTCWWFPEEWCHKVQFSKYSKTFGVPNPYLGLLMYIVIIGATYLASIGSISSWIPMAVVAFGFAFSMYFTAIQAFVLRAFCTWCVISALNFTVMFVVLVIFK